MAASQTNISPTTPMGANLIPGGATFRVWAPNAIKVYIIFDFSVQPIPEPADQGLLLLKDPSTGHWTGFITGITDRQEYMFYVVGVGSTGSKRDPYARELATPFPGTCYYLPLKNGFLLHREFGST